MEDKKNSCKNDDKKSESCAEFDKNDMSDKKSEEDISEENWPGESNAAKILKSTGWNKDENEPPCVVKKAGFFENYWYHHKWATIIAAFFIFIGGVLIFQMATKEKIDIYMLYCGPASITGERNRAIVSVIGQTMSEDYNGDKKKGVMFSTLSYMNKDQIEAAEKSNPGSFVNTQVNMSNYNQFQSELMVGNTVIYLLDPSLYESIRGNGVFVRLDEIFDSDLDSAMDEYGIRLSDTKLYKYYTALQVLPEDTVMCVRRVSDMSVFKGKNKAKKNNEYHVKMIKDIISFEYPEGYTETD